MPLSEKEIREAEAEHIVRAPVKRAHRAAGAVRADADRGAAGEPAHLLRVARAAAAAAAPTGKGRSTRKPCHRREALVKRASARAESSMRSIGTIPMPTPSCISATPFELLVATILSAQSTDARVNIVTPALFARYPDARALAAANADASSNRIIVSTGFFRQKAKSIIGMAQRARRAARRRGARRHGGADEAARRRPQDRERRARPRARRARAAGRSPRAARVEPDRPRQATIRRRSRRICAPCCRPSDGRAPPTR